MPTWYTSKPSEYAAKSHINRCVFDSTWEASEAFELDRNDHVEAWVKNDHLGFEILYTYQGVVHKYYPDYLIRLKNGDDARAGSQRAGHPARPDQARISG